MIEELYNVRYIHKKYVLSICATISFRNIVIWTVLFCYVILCCWANVGNDIGCVLCGDKIYREMMVGTPNYSWDFGLNVS